MKEQGLSRDDVIRKAIARQKAEILKVQKELEKTISKRRA